MGSCWELLEGAGSKMPGRWAAGRLPAAGQRVLPAWRLLLCSLQVLGSGLEEGESCAAKPYVLSSECWETLRAWRGKKGKEPGGIGNLEDSLGGSRYHRPRWEECVYAAGLLLDTDSAGFGHPKGC